VAKSPKATELPGRTFTLPKPVAKSPKATELPGRTFTHLTAE
jgi:hypothetical protein